MIAFSIYDKKMDKYHRPMFVENAVSAFRSLSMALKEPNNLSAYPHDFALYEIGRFDEDAGLMVSNGQPKFVEEISNLVPPERSK